MLFYFCLSYMWVACMAHLYCFCLCMRAAWAAHLYLFWYVWAAWAPIYAVFEGQPVLWFPVWDGPGWLLRASRAVISLLVFTVRTRADQVSFPGKDLGLLLGLVGYIMLCG
jgi:hypothetical protein